MKKRRLGVKYSSLTQHTNTHWPAEEAWSKMVSANIFRETFKGDLLLLKNLNENRDFCQSVASRGFHMNYLLAPSFFKWVILCIKDVAQCLWGLRPHSFLSNAVHLDASRHLDEAGIASTVACWARICSRGVSLWPWSSPSPSEEMY